MSTPNLSLLSLSIAASNAVRIPTADASESDAPNGHPIDDDGSSNPFTSRSGNAALNTDVGSTGAGAGSKHHRRLSSTGKTKRRMSDARDATIRPSSLGTSAGLSLASLSLSAVSDTGTARQSHDRSLSPPDAAGPEPNATPPVKPIAINGKKKRGLDYKCETCSKIYRHPSCLIKHRWEHTPHWREASKYVLSKHQQVQLLEAAAILSHLSPSAPGTSLPEDRSLWPSFLCGGSLPKAEDVQNANANRPSTSSTASFEPQRISSSVPSYAFSEQQHRSRSVSAGPKMHDYNVPVSATQVRPGVLSVTRSRSATKAMAIPITVPSSSSMQTRSSSGYRGSVPSSADPWSLSSSSARSGSDDESVGNISRSSQTRLRARGGADMMKWEEEEDASEDEELEEEDGGAYRPTRAAYPIPGAGKKSFGYTGYVGVKEEDVAMEWDGGDMEMEMD